MDGVWVYDSGKWVNKVFPSFLRFANIIIIFAAIRLLFGGQWFWKFKQFNSFILSIFSSREILQIIKHRETLHVYTRTMIWRNDNAHNVSAFLVGWLNGYIFQTCNWCAFGVSSVCRTKHSLYCLPFNFSNGSFFVWFSFHFPFFGI